MKLLITSIALLISISASATTQIQVFSKLYLLHTPRIKHITIDTYALAIAPAFIQQFNQRLHGMNPDKAEPLARAWLMSKQDLLKHSFHGGLLAQQYGITKLPAIVFNHGQAMVLGTTDVTFALHQYQQWLQRRRA